MSDYVTLLVPPTIPNVEDTRRPVLYSAEGKPLVRPMGFHRVSKG